MRMFLLGFVGLVLYDSSQTITYYSEDIDNATVSNALQQWNLKGVKCVNTTSADKANLIIKKCNKLSVANRYGESNHYEIRINGNYKFENEELSNLIAHEFGHYLFLQHNNKPRSIMNDKSKLSKKTVTQEDKNCLHLLKLRVLFAKFLGKIYYYSR